MAPQSIFTYTITCLDICPCETEVQPRSLGLWVICNHSVTALFLSPNGHINLAVLTGWLYLRGSLNKKMTDWAFVRATIKWP